MEKVIIISIIVICITIIICTVLNHFKDIVDYYNLWHNWRITKEKLDEIYISYYNNEIPDKVNELYKEFHSNNHPKRN